MVFSPDMERSDAELQADRRGLLVAGVWSILVAIGAAVASVLGLAAIVPVSGKREEQWVDAGPEAAVSQKPQRLAVTFDLHQGWSRESRTEIYYAYKEQGGDLVVLDSQCTHLGCTVRWSDSSSRFECPCHGGRFAKNGQVEGGPPSSPLSRPQFRIENSRILIERS